jgi:sarcosine oxidase subunit beta
MKVTLVDRSFLAAEASGRNPGGIRQLGRDPAEVPLAVEAVRLWSVLEEELGYPIEYRQDGYLWVALNEEELELQEELVKRDAAFGLEVHLLDQRGVKKLAPVIADIVLGASFCPTDGTAHPFYVAQGYAQAARRFGARLLYGTEVQDIRVNNGRVESVITSGGGIATRTVINAAGPWSPFIARMVGIELPITPCPNQFILTEAVPPILPPFCSSPA